MREKLFQSRVIGLAGLFFSTLLTFFDIAPSLWIGAGAFFTGRVLDMSTTYFFVKKIGSSVEANPDARRLMQKHGCGKGLLIVNIYPPLLYFLVLWVGILTAASFVAYTVSPFREEFVAWGIVGAALVGMSVTHLLGAISHLVYYPDAERHAAAIRIIEEIAANE